MTDGPIDESPSDEDLPSTPWADLSGMAGQCSNCGLAVSFEARFQAQVWPQLDQRVRQVITYSRVWLRDGVLVLTVLECRHCSKTVGLLHRTYVEGAPGGRDFSFESQQIWPPSPPRSLDDAVPAAVRSFYAEASSCENVGALRAAGVLYRAAVEELVKEQGAAGRDLYSKIESLKSNLGDDLVTNLHEARMVGNDGVHKGLEYSAEEIEDIAELIEEACEALYVAPSRRQALRSRRSQRRAMHKAGDNSSPPD